MNNKHGITKSDLGFVVATAIITIVLLAGLVLISLCVIAFISSIQAL